NQLLGALLAHDLEENLVPGSEGFIQDLNAVPIEQRIDLYCGPRRCSRKSNRTGERTSRSTTRSARRGPRRERRRRSRCLFFSCSSTLCWPKSGSERRASSGTRSSSMNPRPRPSSRRPSRSTRGGALPYACAFGNSTPEGEIYTQGTYQGPE